MVGVPRVSKGDGCTCRHASKATVTASVARICSISRYLSAGSAPLSCVAARAAQPASVVHEAPGAAERLELRQPPSCRRRRRTCRRRRRQEGGEALVAERVTVEIEPPQRGQCQQGWREGHQPGIADDAGVGQLKVLEPRQSASAQGGGEGRGASRASPKRHPHADDVNRARSRPAARPRPASQPAAARNRQRLLVLSPSAELQWFAPVPDLVPSASAGHCGAARCPQRLEPSSPSSTASNFASHGTPRDVETPFASRSSLQVRGPQAFIRLSGTTLRPPCDHFSRQLLLQRPRRLPQCPARYKGL